MEPKTENAPVTSEDPVKSTQNTLESALQATIDSTNEIPNVENLVGRRIENQGDHGTVKYHGPLLHGDDKHDPNIKWIGIEWDNPARGRHNGTVHDVKYFECEGGIDAGSLLKVEKANFGMSIYNGILLRYFNDHHNEEEKTVNEKGVTVEFDKEAYFETFKKFKKKVEFLGFDKIWLKINDLKNLKELSLPNCNISDIGPDGSLEQLLPNVTNLSLEANLLYDWNQVFLIGRELKQLEQLSISNNILPPLQEDVRELKSIFINSNETILNEPPLGVFANLQTLIIISMKLTWKAFDKLAPLFLNVENLVLCFNKFNDFENITFNSADFKNLKFLNLEGNAIEDFEGVKKFKDAPQLDKLTLNQNKLQEFGKITGFENVKTIIMEENNISEFHILAQMNSFPKLETIRITKNPIYTKHSILHIRQRAIAEIKHLKSINGGELKKYERKDCEIYYMRNSFQEYFTKSGQNAYEYNYEQFIDYCAVENPRVPELIKMYGNPYDDVKSDKRPDDVTAKSANLGLVSVKINAFTGAGMGKDPATKKLTSNTLITNLKAMLSKQFAIPANKQKIYYKADRDDPFTPLEEDLKDLSYYGVRNGGEIWVGDTEM